MERCEFSARLLSRIIAASIDELREWNQRSAQNAREFFNTIGQRKSLALPLVTGSGWPKTPIR
jgi:hypothetical protein